MICAMQKNMEKGKIKRSSCQNLKSNFISKRRILDHETQKPNVSIGTVYNRHF